MKSKAKKRKSRHGGISKKRQGQPNERLIPTDECLIPPRFPPEAASKFALEVDDKGREDVVRYMAGQAPDENLKHLEKIKREKVLDSLFTGVDPALQRDFRDAARHAVLIKFRRTT